MSSRIHNSSMQRRLSLKVTGTALALAVLTAFAPAAIAQAYPAKPVRIVVPTGAGGPADIMARVLAERLTKSWGQAVIVENKPGASQMLGADLVAKAAPDGYTFMLGNDGAIAINQSLFAKMPYDPLKDLVPVAKLVTLPLVLVVHPSVQAKSTQEVVALAKSQPGKLNFGSGGSTTRMAGELFKGMTGTDIVHVPYKGSGPMVIGLLGNEVQVAFDGITTSLPQIKGGKLRAIAVTSLTRVPTLPDLPTVAESGVPGFEAGTWLAMFAPAGVPKEIQARVYSELSQIMAQPELRTRLLDMGLTPDLAPPEKFAPQIKGDADKWAQVIKRAGITADN
ncbi:MAG: tripartite tricarboxylate transporter substrate binding protein [Pseudomonadota bacterium]